MTQHTLTIPDVSSTLMLVIGLPGSGKSTYMQDLVARHPKYILFDDYQAETYNVDSDPRLSKHFGPLISTLKAGGTAVVSDIRYCVPYELNLFLASILTSAPSVHIEFVYFENNPEACRQNVIRRNKADEGKTELQLGLIDKLSPAYEAYSTRTVPIYAAQSVDDSSQQAHLL